MTSGRESVGDRLNELLAAAGMEILSAEVTSKFEQYISLFVRWNSRINLSAVRDEDGIISRHLVESIACSKTLPDGIATLLDFGSGGGLPGIPIAICRPEIRVTLAESQAKKAAFLGEVVRVLGLSAEVYARRTETLRTTFDCVTLRAVDKMAEAVSAAAGLVSEGGWLVLMTTNRDLPGLRETAGAEFSWTEAAGLPGSDERIVALGRRHEI